MTKLEIHDALIKTSSALIRMSSQLKDRAEVIASEGNVDAQLFYYSEDLKCIEHILKRIAKEIKAQDLNVGDNS